MGNFENKKVETTDDKIEKIKQEWLEGSDRLEQHREEKNKSEIDRLEQPIKQIIENLKELKRTDPSKLEKLYWETQVIVARDNIYNNAWAAIIAVVSFIFSAFSVIVAVLAVQSGANKNVLWIGIVVAVIAVIVLIFVAQYLMRLGFTRTRSYYHFLLAAAEEIKNTKEE